MRTRLLLPRQADGFVLRRGPSLTHLLLRLHVCARL